MHAIVLLTIADAFYKISQYITIIDSYLLID